MEQSFSNSVFARLYTWMARAKYTMGIFFVVFVVVYLLFGLVAVPGAVTLDFFNALQMAVCCLFVGIVQQAIVPPDKLAKVRVAVWITTGTFITLAFCLVSGWFTAFPLWCFVGFLVIAALGMVGVALGFYFDLHRETRRLNRQLAKFQQLSDG